ncbi:MAG: pyrimidine 5'-nucleotidase [Pseudomonadota bacterium]
MHDRISTWIFDLDNTLYPPETGLLSQINARMTAFVVRELGVSRSRADDYRHETWKTHGITMNALVADHGVDPHAFLAETHDIDYAPLTACPFQRSAVAGLSGRRIIHTNGARRHAERVLDRLELADLFDGIWAIEDLGFAPKPHRTATDGLISRAGFDPATALMIEDSSANLRAPKARGMTTVLVSGGGLQPAEDHIDYVTADLTAFLSR